MPYWIASRWEYSLEGWGVWAIELPEVAPFIGYCGLKNVPFSAPFTPAVEICWRLARPYWGKGYAYEAATVAMNVGFNELGLAELVSFTIPANARSKRLMQRIGMSRDQAGDFEHPLLPEGHPMRPHVLYRTTQRLFKVSQK